MAKSRKKKDIFQLFRRIVFILLVILLLVLCVAAYSFGKALFSNEPIDSEWNAHAYTLQIGESESVFSVGEKLVKGGIIDSSLVFWAQSKLYRCKMKEGIYTVSSDMSSREILQYLHKEYANQP